MGLVLIGAANPGVDRHMIGHQGDSGDALVGAKIFGRVTRFECMQPRLKFLPVGAGMQDTFLNIVVLEDLQFGNGITDRIVGLVQLFEERIVE